MCVQCAAGVTGAIAAGATATGIRAYVALHRPAWLTPRRMRRLSAACVACGLLAAGLLGG